MLPTGTKVQHTYSNPSVYRLYDRLPPLELVYTRKLYLQLTLDGSDVTNEEASQPHLIYAALIALELLISSSSILMLHIITLDVRYA